MQGVDIREEPLVALFSVTSTASGGQGLTGNSDKSLLYKRKVMSFGTLADVIVMSHVPCLSSRQDMMTSHNITKVMMLLMSGRVTVTPPNSDKH